mgnify:CR=1 FL=1
MVQQSVWLARFSLLSGWGFGRERVGTGRRVPIVRLDAALLSRIILRPVAASSMAAGIAIDIDVRHYQHSTVW